MNHAESAHAKPDVRPEAEASAWIALLHSPERNAATEAGWRRWIEENPANLKAWERATSIWNEAATLPRRIPRWRTVPRPARMRPVQVVAAATVVAFLSVGGIFYVWKNAGVATTVGEQRSINLADGTRIELNTQSRVVVKYDTASRTVVLKAGEAYFSVAHEKRPFVVIAGDRKIIALGTSFTVRRENSVDGDMTVTLIEGRVAVAPLAASNALTRLPIGEVTVLNPGQRLRLHEHDKPTVDTPPIDKVTGWRRGELIFDHTPLRDAAAEFNRYSPVRITVTASEAGVISVSGMFRTGESRSFAQAVSESYHLRLIDRGDNLVLESNAPAVEVDSQSQPPP